MNDITTMKQLAQYCEQEGLDAVYWASRTKPGLPMPEVGVAVCIPHSPGVATKHIASFWHTQDGELRRTK